jgi:hypothetical protein
LLGLFDRESPAADGERCGAAGAAKTRRGDHPDNSSVTNITNISRKIRMSIRLVPRVLFLIANQYARRSSCEGVSPILRLEDISAVASLLLQRHAKILILAEPARPRRRSLLHKAIGRKSYSRTGDSQRPPARSSGGAEVAVPFHGGYDAAGHSQNR